MKRSVILGAAVCAAFLVACDGNPPPSPAADHVYIAGTVGTGRSDSVPVYWQDQTLHYLPLDTGFTNGWASGIATDSTGTVYASGGQWGATTAYGYWKGSTFTELSLGSHTVCWDLGIAVDALGNVWVAAILGDASPPTIQSYWKNSGSPNVLTDCTNLWGIGADDSGTIILAGTVGGSSQYAPSVDYDWTAAYWTIDSGVLAGPFTLPLSGTYTNSYAGQVAADSAGNAYICGLQWSATEPGQPVYWKNDENPIQLSTGAYSAYEYWSLGITSVDAAGKLFFAGRIGPTTVPTTVVYWNGATSDPAPLSLGGNSYWNIWNEAGVADWQGNFIIVGSVGGSTDTTLPVYWQNGADYVQLPLGPGDTYGEAKTIVAGP